MHIIDLIEFKEQPFPYLETKRLSLRPVNIKDQYEVRRLLSSKKVAKFLDREVTTTISEARLHIIRMRNGVRAGHWLHWAISLQENPLYLGSISLWNFSEDGKKADIGFNVIPANQGNGYTREAVTEVLRYAQEEMGISEVFAHTHSNNLRSINLLTKSGFQYQKEFVVKNHTKAGESVMHLFCYS